jgi:hypothetical protein
MLVAKLIFRESLQESKWHQAKPISWRGIGKGSRLLLRGPKRGGLEVPQEARDELTVDRDNLVKQDSQWSEALKGDNLASVMIQGELGPTSLESLPIIGLTKHPVRLQQSKEATSTNRAKRGLLKDKPLKTETNRSEALKGDNLLSISIYQ